MLYLAPFMIWCVVLALVIQNRSRVYQSVKQGIKYDMQMKTLFFVLVISMVLFAGLRTAYNDTVNYTKEFSELTKTVPDLGQLLEPYGGYYLYRDFIFNHISTNPQMLLFISAAITTTSYMLFIKKYAVFYAETIFLYSFGAFVVSMAALKQALAIAFALWAIDGLMKKNYIKFVILILVGSVFHPTALCFFSIIFLKEKTFGRKTILAIALIILFVFNINRFIEPLLAVGQDITQSDYYDGYSINPMRIAIEAVPIVLAIVYRRSINRRGNQLVNLGINMQMVGFGFIVCGLFYDPVSMGRMQTYYNCLNALVIPPMLDDILAGNRDKRILKFGYYALFLIYFLLDFSKLGTISLSGDIFEHVGIGALFK